MVTIGSLGAVLVLAFVSPTIEAFFIWQASVGLVYALAIRTAAWRIIEKTRKNRFDIDELKRIWRFTASMSLISLMGVVFTQLDKVLLSRMLGLEEFAHYMLATVVVSSLHLLTGPVYNVVYPRFSALVGTGDAEGLTAIYRLSTRMLALVLFPIAMILVVFAEDVVYIWTGNSSIASSVAPVISLLAIGSALNGIMFIPHALQLAFGMARLPLVINGFLMVIILPLIIFFAATYGAIGGAIAWLMLHVSYVFFGTWLMHKNILIGLGKKWLLIDVGVPLGLTITSGLMAVLVCKSDRFSVYIEIGIGGFLAFLSIVIGMFMTPKLRALIYCYFCSGKRMILNKYKFD